MKTVFSLDDAIRKIPDFPKKGILFYDITSILMNPKAFAYCVDSMEEIYHDKKIDAVAAIESRGFVFASPFAIERGLPLILVRKKGKLPGKTVSKSYALEYGTAELEVHVDDIPRGKKVLIVDDLIATGGTVKAVAEMLSENGAECAGVFGVVGLPFLGYEKTLGDIKAKTLIEYFGE
jgi:adenine phosphoribosyltransferase